MVRLKQCEEQSNTINLCFSWCWTLKVSFVLKTFSSTRHIGKASQILSLPVSSWFILSAIVMVMSLKYLKLRGGMSLE